MENKKTKVWLFKVGEALPTDKGNPRLLRMGLIAEELRKRDVDILWWTSSFDHNKKSFRCDGPNKLTVDENYHIQLLHGCGYTKNASIGRFRHYYIEEKQFFKLADQYEKPDIIIAAMPNIDLAEAAIKYGKTHNIPVIIDIRDMWPDIYVDLSNNKKWLVKIAIQPMRKRLRYILKNATGIFATSDKFLDWGLKYADREKNEFDNYYYVSYPDTNIDISDNDVQKWKDMGIKETDLVCCFFGQFGHAVDLDTVMIASTKLSKTNPNIKFVICGMGEKLESYKKIIGENKNVIFPGWVDRTQICALGTISNVGLLSYRKTPNYEWSMPNKFCEYLALGQAVLVQPKGMMEKMANEHFCGYQYDTDSDLVEKLSFLDENREILSSMQKNSRNLYCNKFRSDVVYGELAEKLIEFSKRG